MEIVVPQWGPTKGRDLDPLPKTPGRWQRVVALLNVWNDLAELELNLPTWYPHVDAVHAVDGAYRGVEAKHPYSTDGTLEYLESLDKVKITRQHQFWDDQVVKRSRLFDCARPGDLLWIIDADEHYENAGAVREAPDLDVGWIRYAAPIYARGQNIPRVLAYRTGLTYWGRHHWIYEASANGDGMRLIKQNQIGGPGLVHRLLDVRFYNRRDGARPKDRIRVARKHRQAQAREEAKVGKKSPAGHEPLRIFQTGDIDPGCVIYRLHSAINTTTPHESVMAISRQDWNEPPLQFELRRHQKDLTRLAQGADIWHAHINYSPSQLVQFPRGIPTVIHHHGTIFRQHHQRFKVKDQAAALRLVSNFELLQYDDDLQWLPNPVPVAIYARLRRQRRREDDRSWPGSKRRFRVAHSPTKPELKGTDVLEQAVDELRSDGMNVEVVKIHRVTHAKALRMKAECDACFDSLWLGLQCSGLEAAAMGLPVVAGDPLIKAAYEERVGEVPYTFANDVDTVRETLRRLIKDRDFYEAEARRVYEYTLEYHDYPQVVTRYLDLLDDALGWRARMRLGSFRGALWK